MLKRLAAASILTLAAGGVLANAAPAMAGDEGPQHGRHHGYGHGHGRHHGGHGGPYGHPHGRHHGRHHEGPYGPRYGLGDFDRDTFKNRDIDMKNRCQVFIFSGNEHRGGLAGVLGVLLGSDDFRDDFREGRKFDIKGCKQSNVIVNKNR